MPKKTLGERETGEIERGPDDPKNIKSNFYNISYIFWPLLAFWRKIGRSLKFLLLETQNGFKRRT